MMYLACCRRPGGTPRTDQEDDQDLAQRKTEREGHRGQREERGERDDDQDLAQRKRERGSQRTERRAWGARLFLPQLTTEGRGWGGGGQVYSCLNSS